MPAGTVALDGQPAHEIDLRDMEHIAAGGDQLAKMRHAQGL